MSLLPADTSHHHHGDDALHRTPLADGADALLPLPAPGLLHLDGWAGRRQAAVTVVAVTPARYRIRAEGTLVLPRRVLERGDTALVPRHAITFPSA